MAPLHGTLSTVGPSRALNARRKETEVSTDPQVDATKKSPHTPIESVAIPQKTGVTSTYLQSWIPVISVLAVTAITRSHGAPDTVTLFLGAVKA